jgi:uridine phosphorylase
LTLKNSSHTHFHFWIAANDSTGSQPVTIGTPERSATIAPGVTSAGVQDPSSAVTWSWVMSCWTLLVS